MERIDAVDRISVGETPLLSPLLSAKGEAELSPDKTWGFDVSGEFTADVSMVMVGARSLRRGVDGCESGMMNPNALHA